MPASASGTIATRLMGADFVGRATNFRRRLSPRPPILASGTRSPVKEDDERIPRHLPGSRRGDRMQ